MPVETSERIVKDQELMDLIYESKNDLASDITDLDSKISQEINDRKTEDSKLDFIYKRWTQQELMISQD